MKLSRLDIVGFKSFADKVTLNFSDGITAVVGPNGCGKSNIVDGIRWVMGEQSAKHLRGGKMEDVIFSGSESRGPMGMAEVTLTLKNDGRVPSEYANYEDIAVRRRLFRDGQSEYYINKTQVRLKDVHDLFLGTGVGTRAYSMIEQGRIGFIVNSKPEERRFLIEEVAGITKYKARKKTAQRRMEATEQNLLRVNDIVTELGRQLGSLERQAKKAERYRELKEQLRDLELWYASMRFLELRAGLVYSLAENEKLQSNEDDLGNALAAKEAQLEASRVQLSETEANNARYAEQVHSLDSRLRLLERDLEFFAKERESLFERGNQAAAEAESLARQQETVLGEIKVLEEHASTLGGESETVMAELEQSEAKMKALVEQRRSLEARAEVLQKEMIDALTVLANERATVQNNDRRRIELQARIERHAGEASEIDVQLSGARERAAQAHQDTERLHAMVDDLRYRLSALDEQVARGKQASHAAAAKVLMLKEQTGERKSRLSSLQEIEKKYEGYDAGVQAVMTGRDPQAHGILGLVADVVSAKSEHEGALEAVLGARLQDVIVQSEAAGVDTLAWLKGEAEGRATFIPADLRERSSHLGVQGQGVLGRLLDLVTVKAGFERVAKYLLGSVVLTDTVASALALSRTAPEGYVFVSLAGDVVDAFGVLSGGKTKGVSEGLLAQKREIKELEDQVRQLENSVLLAEAEKAQMQAALLANEELLKATGEELKDSEIRRAKTEKDVSTLAGEVKRLEQRQEQIGEEIAGLTRSLTELDAATVECTVRMQAAQALHEAKERELGTLTDRDATLRDEEAYAQESLTQLKVSFAQRDEKQKNVMRTLERLRLSLQETDDRIARAKTTVTSGTSQAEVLKDKIEKGKEERVTLLDLLEEGKETLQRGRIGHEQLVTDVRGLEEQVKVLARQAGGLRDEKSTWELKAKEAIMQIEHLKRSINETYQLEIEHEVSEFHMRGGLPESAADDVSHLKSQIARMGDINLTAIDEYKEVSSRHTFLVTQKEDLETALTQLRSAILKINRTSRDRFQEAFNATNAMFQKVFPRLFRGGEARLELMLEGTDDVLESGIDIISQPPGKKLQSVQLLSGGEKALTAVSLVFSIFLIKPSPFCVLDEVDAPLDESNVARFNELLREISQVSQFICITHSKKTMECADRLYGVTMEEPGISKLVSVDLRRAEKVPEGSIIAP
ncbi:MAG: chromosome segregation protein SMC [Deltaproteobacteria bacterium]|nr:chromosome segregation protein SMC [Deltaproteobacteria bacterium]